MQQPGYRVSYTTAKKLFESNPERLIYDKRKEIKEGRKDTPAFREGRMIESCVFDGDGFYQKYECINGYKMPMPNTKNYDFIVKMGEGMTVEEAKVESGIRLKVVTLEKNIEQEWGPLIDFLKRAKGKKVITKEELDMCQTIRDRLHAHSDFKYAIDDATFQERIEWTDKETGVECKAFLDCRNIFGIHEFKTAKDASNSGFFREARQRHYDVQLASQMDGTGDPNILGTWIVVEKTPPYAIRFIPMSQNDFENGLTVWRRWLKDWKRLAEEKAWDQGYEFWGETESQINRYVV